MNSASDQSHRRIRDFRLIALVLASLIGAVLAEGVVRFANLMPLQREATSMRNGAITRDEDDDHISRLIIHPYRGFSPRPGFETEETARWLARSNLFGIRSMVADPRALREEELVVGIFGGSVARGTVFRGRQPLREAVLRSYPECKDSLRIINFAIGGYKQPQQLYLLSELLLLKVPIDIVVNIDGFNEIALGTTDATRGHHPLYPEHNFWLSTMEFSNGSLSPRQIELSAKIISLKNDAEVYRELLDRVPILRHSALIQCLVGSVVLKSERGAIALEEGLRNEPRGDREEAVFTLPNPHFTSDDERQQFVAGLWRRSSEQMKSIAETFGASYIHILQPNQYVKGSKTLNAKELATAWAPNRPWSRAATTGYPFLRTSGKELTRNGVDFHDLTTIFQDHQETIYIDVCCHLNDRGYQILGSEIGKLVGRTIGNRDMQD